MRSRKKKECPACAKFQSIYDKERALLEKQTLLLFYQSETGLQGEDDAENELLKARLADIFMDQFNDDEDAIPTGIRYLARSHHFFEIAKNIIENSEVSNQCAVDFF